MAFEGAEAFELSQIRSRSERIVSPVEEYQEAGLEAIHPDIVGPNPGTEPFDAFIREPADVILDSEEQGEEFRRILRRHRTRLNITREGNEARINRPITRSGEILSPRERQDLLERRRILNEARAHYDGAEGHLDNAVEMVQLQSIGGVGDTTFNPPPDALSITGSFQAAAAVMSDLVSSFAAGFDSNASLSTPNPGIELGLISPTLPASIRETLNFPERSLQPSVKVQVFSEVYNSRHREELRLYSVHSEPAGAVWPLREPWSPDPSWVPSWVVEAVVADRHQDPSRHSRAHSLPFDLKSPN